MGMSRPERSLWARVLASLLARLDGFFRRHFRRLRRKEEEVDGQSPVEDADGIAAELNFSGSMSTSEVGAILQRVDKRRQKKISRQIDRLLKKERKQLEREIKVLLLGPGESGKSTVLRQMRIIHNDTFTDDELQEVKEMIMQDVCLCMYTLCMERERHQIDFHLTESPLHWESFRERFEPSKQVVQRIKYVDFIKHALDIGQLWRDQAIRDTYDIRYKFKLSDSCAYFFNEMERIKQANYVPTPQDVLFARRATVGIKESVVAIPRPYGAGSVPFRFIDVGGQRSRRGLWRTVFHGVHAVLFLAPCSEFNQVLAENAAINRLEESLRTFAWVVHEKAFERSCIILFLNKLDLLIEKVVVHQRNIRDYFPLFDGDPTDVRDVQNFILNMFRQRARKKTIYVHFTTATDTHLMRSLVNDVKDRIIKMNLNSFILNEE